MGLDPKCDGRTWGRIVTNASSCAPKSLPKSLPKLLPKSVVTKRLWRAFPSGRWRPSFTAVPFHASRSQRESSVLQHTASLAMARDRTNTDALRYALAAANVSATCPQPTRNAPSACRSGMNLNAAEFSDYTEQVLCRAVPQRLLSPSVPRFVPTRHAPRCAAGGRGPLQHVQGVRSR